MVIILFKKHSLSLLMKNAKKLFCLSCSNLQIIRDMFVEPAVKRIQESHYVTSFFLFKMYKDVPYEILESIYGVSKKTLDNHHWTMDISFLSGFPKKLGSCSNSKRFF
jgi:hypothetical protein